MKKLFIILSFIMVIGLGACASSQEPYNDKEIKDDISYIEDELELEIERLESQINALNERLDNLIVVHGINGNTAIYETQSSISRLSMEVEMLKDSFDKLKAPAYIVDDTGAYVTLERLFYLMKEKYYGDANVFQDDYSDMGQKAHLRFRFDGTYDGNELLARTILLIEEMRNYEFYVLSCPELVIEVFMYDGTELMKHLKVTIPLVVMINDFFTITPDGIYDGDYEMDLEVQYLNITLEGVQTYYDDFILNETFSGFVLNWE